MIENRNIKAIVIDDEAEALTRMEYVLDKFPEIEVLKYLADPTKMAFTSLRLKVML